MSERPKGSSYWTEPGILYDIGDALTRAQRREVSFAKVCENVLPMLVETLQVEGVDNIPSEGTVIVIKNHPTHFDGMTLGKVFEKRPDIRHIVGLLRFAELISLNYLPIRKDPVSRKEDIRILQEHLARGGSIVSTPWGSLDHMAKQLATPQRSVQNIIRCAAFGDATVVPVHIDVAWENVKSLPVKSALVSIQEPVIPGSLGIDEEQIAAAVTTLYEKYTA